MKGEREIESGSGGEKIGQRLKRQKKTQRKVEGNMKIARHSFYERERVCVCVAYRETKGEFVCVCVCHRV